MELQTLFLFWPVESVHLVDSWICGNLAGFKHGGTDELMRLARLTHKRSRGLATKHEVQRTYRRHENLSKAHMEGMTYESSVLDALRYVPKPPLFESDRADRALTQFLKLKTNKIEEALHFIEIYGEFDHLNIDNGRFVEPGVPLAVQKFCSDCLLPSARKEKVKDPFAVSMREFWSEHRRIKALWVIARAIVNEDISAAKAECERRRPHQDFPADTQWLEMAKEIFSVDISASIYSCRKPPRIVLNHQPEKRGDAVPSVFCTTVRTGLYLQMMAIGSGKTKCLECKFCGEAFVRHVPHQQYCKKAHQNAAAVRRWRRDN